MRHHFYSIASNIWTNMYLKLLRSYFYDSWVVRRSDDVTNNDGTLIFWMQFDRCKVIASRNFYTYTTRKEITVSDPPFYRCLLTPRYCIWIIDRYRYQNRESPKPSWSTSTWCLTGNKLKPFNRVSASGLCKAKWIIPSPNISMPT